MKSKNQFLPWLIITGLALAVAAVIANSRGVFTSTDSAEIYAGLSDAFFVPGILLLSFGLLTLVARGGVFDMVGYGARSLLVLFTPFKKPEKHERYYDYKLRRELNRNKIKPYSFIVGAVFLVIAAFCLLLYEQAV